MLARRASKGREVRSTCPLLALRANKTSVNLIGNRSSSRFRLRKKNCHAHWNTLSFASRLQEKTCTLSRRRIVRGSQENPRRAYTAPLAKDCCLYASLSICAD